MELPLFPLNTVLFPGATLPLHVFEERYKQMIGRCLEEKAPFGVCLIRSGGEVGEPAEPFGVGTTAHIISVDRLDDGKLNIICVGGQRFRIREIKERRPYIVADVEMIGNQPEDERETAHVVRLARELFAEYVRLNLAIGNQWTRSIEMPKGASALADHIAARLAIDPWGRQKLLEEPSAKTRLQVEVELLGDMVIELQPRLKAALAARWSGLGVLN